MQTWKVRAGDLVWLLNILLFLTLHIPQRTTIVVRSQISLSYLLKELSLQDNHRLIDLIGSCGI